MKITWPDFKTPPINLFVLPCALWYYYPDVYDKFYAMKKGDRA